MQSSVARWLSISCYELSQYFDWKFCLILASLIYGTYLFFLNPALTESFNAESIGFYLALAKTPYSPQTQFYAESVLFAWLAFLIGASQSLLYYKIFCSFCTLLILPTIAYFAIKYFEDAWRSWLFTLLFAVTYRYLWRIYYLGFPDPLTIIFLAAIAFQRHVLIVFVCTVLAAVSHFSMTLVSLAIFMACSCVAPKLQQRSRVLILIWVISGLIVGRLLLELWFYRFNYKLQSRLDWMLEYGLPAFTTRYEEDILRFWQTPGWSFLFFYLIMLLWFISRRHFYYSCTMVIALALGYLALFLTVDGLRVFAVVMIAPYVFMLRNLVDDLFSFISATQNSASASTYSVDRS